MTMFGYNMLGFGAGISGGVSLVEVANSAVYNSSDAQYLVRTFGTPTDQDVWTISMWLNFRLQNDGVNNYGIFGGAANNTDLCYYAPVAGKILFAFSGASGGTIPPLLRDALGWTHFVMKMSGTSITAYYNGVQVFTDTMTVNDWNSAVACEIGTYNGAIDGSKSSMYMAETVFIDGLALEPTSFGEYDITGLYWTPKSSTAIQELTFGNNGFYLNNATNPQTDASGNGNNFTNNNTVVTSTHTPTNSHATSNALHPNVGTLSNGNKTCTSADATNLNAVSTLPITTKIYFEFEFSALGTNASAGLVTAAHTDDYIGGGNPSVGWAFAAGSIVVNGSTDNTLPATLAANVRGCIAFDPATGELWTGQLSGSTITWDNSGDPDAGTGEVVAASTSEQWFAAISGRSTITGTVYYNEEDWEGVTGLPTTFLALNTTNIAAATTRTASVGDHFQTQLVAHDGSSTDFTLGWNADTYQTLFIAKNRDSTEKWFWVDGVRGYNKYFSSNAGTAQTTDANVISVSGATITLGSTLASAAYVVECFRLGTSSVAADAGTINAVVSVNTVMNWSVILYTGNNAASQTVEHGLSTAPKMFIGENVGGTTAGGYYFEALGNTAIMGLNTANAKSASVTYFQNTSPTSSVISVGANATFNASGNENWVFAVGSGSDFVANGSYEGNGNADGTFIPTIGGNGVPLQPLFALQLSIDSSGARMMHDSKREGYNVDNDELSFESTGAEGTANQIDIVSGGIKNRIASDPNVAETNVYFAVGTPIIDVDGRIIAGR